jgi:hypothetical protein
MKSMDWHREAVDSLTYVVTFLLPTKMAIVETTSGTLHVTFLDLYELVRACTSSIELYRAKKVQKL